MPDLRIVFLFLLLITGVLYVLRVGRTFAPGTLKDMVLDVLLVPAALGTILVFAMLLGRVNPEDVFLQATAFLGRANTVSFIEAIPTELENSLDVLAVDRDDTDGDGFQEWIVLYRSELQSGSNPIQVTIYDNDRGNPPVVFPYALEIPGREVIGLNSLTVDVTLEPVTVDNNGPNQEDLPEVVVKAPGQLGIYRFDQNTPAWSLPVDDPPRYSAIGFFEGNGGADLNSTSKAVTVVDMNIFNRSQLAWRVIYTLNSGRGIQPTPGQPDSYWQLTPLGSNEDSVPILAPPVMSTVDFRTSPPLDIFNTEFPENIVLGFYAATCGSTDNTLCRSTDETWEPGSFLAPNADAALNYNSGNAGYFGLNSLNATQDIQVKNIQLFPELEAYGNCVALEFTLNNAPSQTYAYQTIMVQGKWKIAQRLELTDCVEDLSEFSVSPQAVSEPGLPPLGSPIEISTSQ